MKKYHVFQEAGNSLLPPACGPSVPRKMYGYDFFSEAQKEAEKLCRDFTGSRFVVVKVEAAYWLDPNPKVLSDLPKKECSSGE